MVANPRGARNQLLDASWPKERLSVQSRRSLPGSSLSVFLHFLSRGLLASC